MSGRLLRTLEGHSRPVDALSFSPDGGILASGSRDNTIKLWNLTTGRPLGALVSKRPQNSSLAFTPDGLTLASTVEGGFTTASRIALWDVKGASIKHSFDLGEVGGEFVSPFMPIAFSPNGRVLANATETWTTLLEVATGQILHRFDHSHVVNSIAFSLDGRFLVSGSTDDSIKIWDAETGRLLRTIESRSDGVSSVILSRDERIVSGGEDGTIKVWKRDTGALLATLMKDQRGAWLTLTPEGFFDASEKGAELLSVVRGLEAYSIDQFYQALYRPDLVREKLAGDPQGKVREASARLDLAKVIASGGAPRVTITTPKSGASVPEEQINVEATITDQGGGVSKMEWRVNGVTLGVEQRGLGPEASSAKMLSVRRQLTLEPGDNRIEIIAYNAKGLIASEPARITVKWTGERASAPPRLFVLAVGVNDYWDSRLRLNFAAPDAKAMGEGLRQAGAGLYERVDVTMALDADATNANLDRVFSDLGKQIRPRDVFVFFLAGHAKTVDGRYYFLPYDFRYQGEESFAAKGVGQDRWQEWFARIPAKKSVLLYDTCESGSLTGERIALRGVERVTALEKMTRAMGRTVLAASTDDKPALEGYRGHGVFTYVALEALGQGRADANGLIEVSALADYLDERVPELSNSVFKMRQVPQRNMVGSNFPLVRKTVVLPGASAEPSPVVSAKPTHVVITAARVREAPKASAPVVIELTAGTQVQLVETAEGWVLVARDGKKLGYVEAKELLRLQ